MSLDKIGLNLSTKYIKNLPCPHCCKDDKTCYSNCLYSTNDRYKAEGYYQGGYAYILAILITAIIWGSAAILYHYLNFNQFSVTTTIFVVTSSCLGFISIPIGMMFEKTNPFYLGWLCVKSVLLKLGSTK